MEIESRMCGYTIWAGQDAEGRTAYAVSRDWDGVPVEPAELRYYSLAEAERARRAMGAAEEE